MGNTTEDLARSRRLAEVASRIGARLAAQRVEVYRFDEDDVVLLARWSIGSRSLVRSGVAVPAAWFPWSLGNVRPEEYVFIRNAGALPAAPSGEVTISDLGMASVVHVPVGRTPGATDGSICAYWSEERSSFDVTSRTRLCDWVRDAWDHQR